MCFEHCRKLVQGQKHRRISNKHHCYDEGINKSPGPYCSGFLKALACNDDRCGCVECERNDLHYSVPSRLLCREGHTDSEKISVSKYSYYDESGNIAKDIDQ